MSVGVVVVEISVDTGGVETRSGGERVWICRPAQDWC